MRACASLFNELRNSVFATVSQAAIRRVALETFEHVRVPLCAHGRACE
jgi:hypothetical protein